MNMYFPTIEGKPGRFDGWQIVYCCSNFPVKPVLSRKTIKRQIEKSTANRKSQNFVVADYDIMRIIIEGGK